MGRFRRVFWTFSLLRPTETKPGCAWVLVSGQAVTMHGNGAAGQRALAGTEALTCDIGAGDGSLVSEPGMDT